jgi:hypothetical protein
MPSTRQRWPAGMGAAPVFRADQKEPRSSTLPMAWGAMDSRALAVSPTRESTGRVLVRTWNLPRSGLRSSATHTIEIETNANPCDTKEGSKPVDARIAVATEATPKKNTKKPVGSRISAAISTNPAINQVHQATITGAISTLERNVAQSSGGCERCAPISTDERSRAAAALLQAWGNGLLSRFLVSTSKSCLKIAGL